MLKEQCYHPSWGRSLLSVYLRKDENNLLTTESDLEQMRAK
jgi:hypothetical protein